MKTRFIFLFAAMALLAGCAKEEKAPMANENKEGVTVLQVGLPSNPTVSSSIDSKTHMGEAATQGKHKVYWSNGDKIRVNGEESVALSGLADDASSATFTINSVLDVPYKVLYPSSIYGSSIYYVNLPAVQEYKAGSFAEGALPMAGYSADGTNITMHHLCAIYKVQILRASTDPDEHDIVAVRFRGRNSEQVSGTFEISYDGHSLGASNGSGGDLEVKVVGRQATSTTTPAVYYIVVPARVYQQGFDVIIQDVQGHIMTKSLEGYQFPEAGHLYPLKAFEFAPTGTEVGIEINSAADLVKFAQEFNAGVYAGQEDLVASLGQDIAFDAESSAAFNATGGIGTKSGEFETTVDNYFFGTFNGANHSISGLAASVPLFAYTDGAGVIENITLDNTCTLSIESPVIRSVHATIVGRHKGTMRNCVSNSAITINNLADVTTAEQHYGGLVGRNYGGVIEGCQFNGNIVCSQSSVTITANKAFIGGISGTLADNGSVSGSDFSGNITISDGTDFGSITATGIYFYIGGIVGYADNGVISNCDAATAGSSNAVDARGGFVPSIGGIVGWGKETGVKIEGCNNYMSFSFKSNAARQSTTPTRIGGISGRCAGMIKSCTNSGAISTVCNSTSIYLAGIVGEGINVSYCTNNEGGTITRTNQLANAQANRYIYLGGILGTNAAEATIDNCINKAIMQNNIPGTSTLTTVDMAGILAWGQYKATITNCSNSGEVHAIDGNNAVKYPRTALGGIIGSGSAADISIKNSSNSGQIFCQYYKSGTKCNGRLSYVGGIAGALAEFSNDGDTPTKLITGGLGGFEINSCTNTGVVWNRNYNNTSDDLTTSPYLGGIIGVVCGTSESKAKIYDCKTSTATYTVYRGLGGGIAGYSSNGDFQRDSSSVSITGTESAHRIGGIVAWSEASSLIGCVFSGTAEIIKHIGGLVSKIDATSSISSCKVDGATLANASSAAEDKSLPAVLVNEAPAGASITNCGVSGTLNGAAITLDSNMITTNGGATVSGTYLL